MPGRSLRAHHRRRQPDFGCATHMPGGAQVSAARISAVVYLTLVSSHAGGAAGAQRENAMKTPWKAATILAAALLLVLPATTAARAASTPYTKTPVAGSLAQLSRLRRVRRRGLLRRLHGHPAAGRLLRPDQGRGRLRRRALLLRPEQRQPGALRLRGQHLPDVPDHPGDATPAAGRRTAGSTRPATSPASPCTCTTAAATPRVKKSVNDDLVRYYQHFGASVQYDTGTSAGHAWVTPYGTVRLHGRPPRRTSTTAAPTRSAPCSASCSARSPPRTPARSAAR